MVGQNSSVICVSQAVTQALVPPAERASPTQVVEPPEAFLLSREEIANLETKKKNHLETDYG